MSVLTPEEILRGIVAQGSDIQVNQETLRRQENSDVLYLSNGNILVTWETEHVTAGSLDVAARIFAPDGTPVTDEFVVNAGAGSQNDPALVPIDNGRAMIIWQDSELRYRIMESDGTFLTGDFMVNTSTLGSPQNFKVHKFDSQDFFVTWQANDSQFSGAYGQRFMFSGNKEYTELLFNTTQAGGQVNPSVAEFNGDAIVAVWESSRTVNGVTDRGIYMQTYSNTNTATGGERAVVDTTGFVEADPQVVALSGGGFVVMWRNGTTNEIWAKTYSPSSAEVAGSEVLIGASGGVAVGQDPVLRALANDRYVVVWPDGVSNSDVMYRVNEADGSTVSTGRLDNSTFGTQNDVRVHKTPDGGFVTVFFDSSSTLGDIYVTRHDADGRPMGSATDLAQLVNATTTRGQFDPAVDVDDDGNMVVTWTSDRQDGNGTGVFMRTLDLGTFGTDGADTLVGTPGTDLLNGLGGDDSITGLASDDTLLGGDGNDTLEGGAGDDVLRDDAGDDLIRGGDGDDTWQAITGADTFEGGPGSDTVLIDLTSAAPQSFIVDFNLTIGDSGARGNPNLRDSYTDVENLDFSGNIDVHAIGNGSSNTFVTDEGDDTLDGLRGADTLSSGAGNDLIHGDGFQAEFAENIAAQVYRLYQATLGRAPDRAGQIDWTGRIDSGAQDLQQVAGGFVGSTEFQNVYGALTDTAFVELLYQNVLNRPADSGGLANWVGRLGGGTSRAEVVTGFSESLEFINNTRAAAASFARDANPANWVDEVFRVYQATLDRNPDIGGLLNWTGQLSEGRSLLSVIEGFTGSTEFQQTYGSLSESAFVELLYQNVLGRPADSAGLADWTGRLASGTTRAEVVRGFSESAEFITSTTAAVYFWVKGQGVHDQITSGIGDDTMSGGEMSDLFVFYSAHDGNDVVRDLENWDVLQFTGFGYADAAAARGFMSEQGDDVVFSDQGVTVLIENMTLAALSDDMISV